MGRDCSYSAASGLSDSSEPSSAGASVGAAASVLLALKVRFQPGLGLPEVERAINDLEERIRTVVPSMKKIFVEPDSTYDAALDPPLSSAAPAAAARARAGFAPAGRA